MTISAYSAICTILLALLYVLLLLEVLPLLLVLRQQRYADKLSLEIGIERLWAGTRI